jgi:murein DD-endopeptidase MepM/ murein hydrolase activator NlpD
VRCQPRATTYLLAALVTIVLALVVTAASFASPNGGSGGTGAATSPQITDARCIPQPNHDCIEPRWAGAGATIRLAGRYLATVRTVVFYGRRGPTDDVSAPAIQHGSTRVTTRVPQGAHNGPLAVVTTAGSRSRRWTGLVIDEPAQPPPLPKQTGSQPSIGTVVSAPRKVFYGGLQKPVFNFQVGGDRPVDVTIRLIRVADQAVVRTWVVSQVQPGVGQRVVWDGTAGGKVQPEGLYAFQAGSGGVTGAVNASADGDDSFAFYGNMFPIRGRHEYNLGAGRFGAGRQGHTHQGQDVFATCGTPLVAARAGKVYFRGYHSLAGYYLVISGDGAGQDYVYMHLRSPALVKAGQHVYTGQPIGEVGQTGDAQGCHLHFELWTAPGWYKGGRPFDPLPQLKGWDKFS